jgi:hypothetical protein
MIFLSTMKMSKLYSKFFEKQRELYPMLFLEESTNTYHLFIVIPHSIAQGGISNGQNFPLKQGQPGKKQWAIREFIWENWYSITCNILILMQLNHFCWGGTGFAFISGNGNVRIREKGHYGANPPCGS